MKLLNISDSLLSEVHDITRTQMTVKVNIQMKAAIREELVRTIWRGIVNTLHEEIRRLERQR